MSYIHTFTKNIFTKLLIGTACLMALSGADFAFAAVESRSRAEASIRTVINGQEITNIHKVRETSDGSPATVQVESQYQSGISETTSAKVKWSVTNEPSVNRQNRNNDFNVDLSTQLTTTEQIQRIIRELRQLLNQLNHQD